MKNNKKKKKLLAAAAALALIAAMSGTFAWLTSQDQAINRAKSSVVKDDSVSISEEFTPIPLQAGTSTPKIVKAQNTGTSDVFVRVSYEEVLKHLTDKGTISYDPDNGATDGTNPKYTDLANDPGLAKNMPVEFDWAKSVAEGFVVSEGTVNGVSDPNVLLLIKGQRIENTLQPDQPEFHYEGKLVHRYRTDTTTPANNQYQIMSFDSLELVGKPAAGVDVKDWEFTVSGVKFGYYKDGYKNTVANWATSSLAPTGKTTPTGNAVLGETGIRHNVNFDYTPATLGIASIPAPTVVTDDTKGQLPAANAEKSMQADQVDPIGDEIKVKYSANITDTDTLTDEMWVYNPEDGWFYYTVPLKAPVAGTDSYTEPLIERLIFDAGMGDEYKNASYDLVVKLEAIYANREALTGSDGWNLSGTETMKIVNKLAPVTP